MKRLVSWLRYNFSHVLDLLPPAVGLVADAYYAVQEWRRGRL